MLNGTVDWYAEFADYLVANSVSLGDGRMLWNNGSTAGGQISTGSGQMSTAWGVIILSPSLFELPPSASCSVTPSIIGKNGGTVSFSATASFHPDPNATITGYSWNFDDATANGTGVMTTHTYAVPGTGGEKFKDYIPFIATKGAFYSYQLSSSAPFTVYSDESTVRVQPWGGSVEWTKDLPLIGLQREGTTAFDTLDARAARESG